MHSESWDKTMLPAKRIMTPRPTPLTSEISFEYPAIRGRSLGSHVAPTFRVISGRLVHLTPLGKAVVPDNVFVKS